MAREVLSNGVINPDKYQADWYADLSNNWNLLNNLIGSAISGSEVDSKIATAIQELMVRTFQIVAELPQTGTEGVMYLVIIPDTSKYTAYVWENSAYRELGVIQMTITIDDELSATSENPVQNKVITNALGGKASSSHTHSASDITSGLSTVATSGSYNDLSNKPTIPTVNNATLTIQQNGTTVDSFTANSNSDKTVNIQCVDLSSNQTVGGNKTFSNGLFASKSAQGDLAVLVDDSINSTNEDANGMPLTGHTNSLKIRGRDTSILPCMLVGQIYTNGDTAAQLRAYKYKDLASNAMIQLRYIYNDGKGTVTFNYISYILPNITNTTNLGSPSLQWNNTYTRNILIDNDINIASSLINKTSTSGTLALRSGINPNDGASIGLYAKDYSGALSGCIYMTAYGNSDNTSFRIFPNGTITVYNNSTNTTKNVAMQEDVVPRSGGETVMTGNVLGRNNDNDRLTFRGCSAYDLGAQISLYGKDAVGVNAGAVYLHPSKGSSASDWKDMYLYPSGTWTWDGTACQITSDQRYKQQIAEIDDKLLDAWEDVNLVQFKYNDAVDQKKDNARLHTGYVVQQIDEACQKHNLDISEYGLYCHEEYPEETEEVEVEQEDGTKTKEKKVIREASEHYSLRYTEALIVECAYLRKCIKELRAEIEQLKSSK